MYEWDESKRRANLAKHEIDFADMARFDWMDAVYIKTETVDFEERFTVLGRIDTRVIAVVFTDRGTDVRIISMRSATRAELQHWLSVNGYD